MCWKELEKDKSCRTKRRDEKTGWSRDRGWSVLKAETKAADRQPVGAAHLIEEASVWGPGLTGLDQ